MSYQYTYSDGFEPGDKVIILDGHDRQNDEYRDIGWDDDMDEWVGEICTLSKKYPDNHCWHVSETHWLFSDELMRNLSLEEREAEDREFDNQEFEESFIKFMNG